MTEVKDFHDLVIPKFFRTNDRELCALAKPDFSLACEAMVVAGMGLSADIATQAVENLGRALVHVQAAFNAFVLPTDTEVEKDEPIQTEG
jgi:hypothetical protein